MSWPPEVYKGQCFYCEREEIDVSYYASINGEVCLSCYREHLQPRFPCRRCKKIRPTALRATNGGPICPSCYHALHVKPCVRCGKLRPATLKLDKGFLCTDCYAAPPKLCVGCGEVRSLAQRLKEDPRQGLCSVCYTKSEERKEPCSICGESKVPGVRTEDKKPVCFACYQRVLHREACSSCGRDRTVYTRIEAGNPLCGDCYTRDHAPRAPCAMCGTETPRRQRNQDGEVVCRKCYNRHVRPKSPCSQCGEVAIVQKRTRSGEPLCPRCGIPKKTCSECGELRTRAKKLPEGGGLCHPCYGRARWREKRES